MKRPSFYQGIGIALFNSVLGGAVYSVFAFGVSDLLLIHTLIPILSFVYVIYLLGRSKERVGHVFVMTVWTVVALAMWLLMPPLMFILGIHVGLIWLIRSLYFYSSVLSSLLDLSLSSIALVVGIWAEIHTASLLVGIWCFFLIQAIFVFIPVDMKKTRITSAPLSDEDHFDKAYQSAESAIHSISNQN